MFKLLDLLMGRESFYMKYHLKAQDLPNNIAFIILEIISKIVHHKKFHQYYLQLLSRACLKYTFIHQPLFSRQQPFIILLIIIRG